MIYSRQRPLLLTGLVALVLVITAATQGPKFMPLYVTASDGNSVIGLDFDSTGTVNVYVDNQAFSKGTWEAKADTLAFGPVTGPEGYSCSAGGKYLWSLAENRLTFTLLADDCQVRSEALTGLVWTKR
jgi:hypothetical protein